jgi:hypothetical protein
MLNVGNEHLGASLASEILANSCSTLFLIKKKLVKFVENVQSGHCIKQSDESKMKILANG